MEFFLLFLQVFFTAFELLIVARIILSWIAVPLPAFLVRFLLETTEPFLGFFRRIIPPLGMFDFSPVIAIFALEFGSDLLLRFLGSL